MSKLSIITSGEKHFPWILQGNDVVISRSQAIVSTVQVWGLVLLTLMSFFPFTFHYEESIFFGLLTMAVIAAWKDGHSVWTRNPIDLPLLLLVGWVLATVPFAIDPAYSFSEWRKLVVQMLVFYWSLLVLRRYDDGSTIRRILIAIALGTVIVSGYSLMDFISRGGSLSDRFIRAEAPLAGPNWLSTYLVIAIPLVIVACVVLSQRWQRLACWGGVFVPALLAQAFSYVRSGWIALAVEGLMFGLVTGRRRFVAGLVGLCLVGLLTLLAVAQIGYQRNTVDPLTFQVRLQLWKLGGQEIFEHPFVGIGYGSETFSKRFRNELDESQDSVLHKSRHGTHNTFLMFAMGSGIPALAILLWLLATAGVTLFHRARQATNPHAHAILVGILIMMVGFVTRNMFDYMFTGSLAYLFWILMATGLSEPLQNKQPVTAKL